MENNFEKYRSNSQQRILKTLLLMAGHEINGVAPSQISKALGCSPASTTSDLANLNLAGIAEQMHNGCWRLTPRIPQIAVAMLNGIHKGQEKMNEIRQRYTRTP